MVLFPAPAEVNRTAVDAHLHIGVHFERFDGRRYVPNAEKMVYYPDDDAAAQLLLQQQ